MMRASPVAPALARPLDSTFHVGTGPNAAVECLAVEPEGRILLAGPFTSVNGQHKTGLARLNPDGALDRSFTTVLKTRGGHGQASTIAILPDGRILIAGWFTHVNGVRRGGLARLYPDGSLDRSFMEGMPGVKGWVRDLRLQSDSGVLVGGKLAGINGQRCLGIVRLAGDGSLDSRFAQATTALGQAEVNAIALQRDGRILIGGRFTSAFGTVRHLLRLRVDGSLDPAFLPRSMGPNADVSLIQPRPDGFFVIGGLFTAFDGVERIKVARLQPDGDLDEYFASPLGTCDILCCLAVLPNNAVLVGGRFQLSKHDHANAVALLNVDGTIDKSFSVMFMPTGYRCWVFALALQPEGRVIAGGSFREVNGVRRRNVARLLPDLSQNGELVAAA